MPTYEEAVAEKELAEHTKPGTMGELIDQLINAKVEEKLTALGFRFGSESTFVPYVYSQGEINSIGGGELLRTCGTATKRIADFVDKNELAKAVELFNGN